jgi:hypothetical protein
MTYEQITERIAALTAEHARHVTIVQTCRAQIDTSTHEAARLKGMIQGLQEVKDAMKPILVDAGPAPAGMPETPRVDPKHIDPERATVIPIFPPEPVGN